MGEFTVGGAIGNILKSDLRDEPGGFSIGLIPAVDRVD
jgi:hypothetical protein